MNRKQLKTITMNKFLLLATAALFLQCTQSNAETKKVAKAKPAKSTAAAPAATVKHITKAEYLALVYNYEKNPDAFAFEGKLPAIVDFYADWCGPCKRVAPILDKMAAKYAGKVNIYKVDVDNEKELASAHGIRSIPTMIFFPMKGQPQVVQGALPEAQLEDALTKILQP